MTGLVVFLVTLFVGVPIYVAIGLTSWVSMGSFPLTVLIDQMVSALNSFPLVALPLFLLMGNLMGAAGITRTLVAFANMLVGRFRGGLSIGAIGSGVFFASISGSAAADTSALASVLVPAMKEEGYSGGYSGALVAAAGTLGSIIPPSILLVIYGVQTGTSIEGLFVAGILPGLVVAAGMIFLAIYIAHRRGYPLHRGVSMREGLRTTFRALPVLMLPAIVIVGIIAGIFTITESAAVAVAYAVVLVLVSRRIGAHRLWSILIETAKETASVTAVIAASAALAWPLTRSQVPAELAAYVTQEVASPVLILLLVNLLLLFLGMFLAPAAALVLVTPILLPIGHELGIGSLQLGLITVFNLNLGLLTPPVGLGLFITARIAGTTYLEQVREALPFLAVNLLVLLGITYLPFVTTALPSYLGH
ncbi:TRAP transporter large permease [Oricola thermophila]|uniref:TRAP transporter large permease protein n=1 Tax=Oricola thermophila TaxID=2742145 RepID=A0A6N1VGY6_9HYPH|nr:TRAP transporter large permease [Oricola thermophila]QKV18552.1 TRAP transporter large permease [Oricola thermophila]